MDIKVEAPQHPRQAALIDYYTSKLNRKYGKYPFLKSIDVKVQEKNLLTHVSLQFKPEKAQMMYVSAEDANENKALNKAIQKMNTLIEKYKQKHYHSVHSVNKNTDV